MKVNGQYLLIVRDRNHESPQPEGEWVFAPDGGAPVREIDRISEGASGAFYFKSATGKTGGRMAVVAVGRAMRPWAGFPPTVLVFEGQGSAWGATHSGFEGRQWAPSTHNVEARCLDGGRYDGSYRAALGLPAWQAAAIIGDRAAERAEAQALAIERRLAGW